MILRRVLIAFIALAQAAGVAHAKSYYGLPDDAMTVGVGARAISLGGAFVAVANDATAPYYNPAGLAMIKAYDVQFMYAPLLYDTNLNYIGAILPAAPWITFGFGGVFLNSGGFERRDASNNILGTSGVSDNLYLFSAGTRIDKYFFGITGKMINKDVVGYQASALGVDLGFMTDVTSWLRVGSTLQNINRPAVRFIDTADTYPVRLNMGARALLPGNIFSLMTQVGTDFDRIITYMMGGELVYGKYFALRAGIDDQSNPVFGFGAKYQDMTFDYAFSNQSTYGNLNRFSFSYRFGDLFKTRIQPKFENGETSVILRATDNVLPMKPDAPRYPVGWWKLVIMANDKSAIRQLGAMGPPPETVEWDLKDNFGRPVRPGKYYYEYSVYYKSDFTWVDTGEIDVTEPSQGAPVKMDIKVTGQ